MFRKEFPIVMFSLSMELGKNSNTGKSIFSSANTRAISFNSFFFDIDLSSKEPANCAWATPLGTP